MYSSYNCQEDQDDFKQMSIILLLGVAMVALDAPLENTTLSIK